MTDAVGTVAIIDGVDVDAVAAAVTACPGVAGMFGGPGDAIAAYLPGRRVPGIEVTPAAVVLHVTSRWDWNAPDLLREISARVTPLVAGKAVEVIVEDLADPEHPEFPTV